MWTLDFKGTRSTQTAVESQHFKTSHSPTTRSISEAPAQDTHHWHDSARQPAIPQVHARFHKHPQARGMHHPLLLRFQVLHQVERYPVVDLNIGVNNTRGCDIMALPKQIHPTNLLVPQVNARFHKNTRLLQVDAAAETVTKHTFQTACSTVLQVDAVAEGGYKAHSTGRRCVRSASRRRPKMFTNRL